MSRSTIIGEATITVTATPEDVFDLVLDLDRYRLADHKIGRVLHVQRNGNAGTVRFAGRLRGLPGPVGTYPFTLTEDRLVVGAPVAGLARWLVDFEASFACTATEVGTTVIHREAFTFKRPLRWIANPLLRRWLEDDTRAEMTRMKEMLEHGRVTGARAPEGAVPADAIRAASEFAAVRPDASVPWTR
jgi:hypothetical protein